MGRRVDPIARVLDSEPLRDTKHDGILERGELWNVIEDVMRRHAIDLIILGSHGKHGFKKLVLGSAAKQIFRQASCPLLTVGPSVPEPEGRRVAFKNSVFATDFSAGSLKALPLALSLAEENKSAVTLPHVTPLVPMQQREYMASGVKKRLEEF